MLWLFTFFMEIFLAPRRFKRGLFADHFQVSCQFYYSRQKPQNVHSALGCPPQTRSQALNGEERWTEQAPGSEFAPSADNRRAEKRNSETSVTAGGGDMNFNVVLPIKKVFYRKIRVKNFLLCWQFDLKSPRYGLVVFRGLSPGHYLRRIQGIPWSSPWKIWSQTVRAFQHQQWTRTCRQITLRHILQQQVNGTCTSLYIYVHAGISRSIASAGFTFTVNIAHYLLMGKIHIYLHAWKKRVT